MRPLRQHVPLIEAGVLAKPLLEELALELHNVSRQDDRDLLQLLEDVCRNDRQGLLDELNELAGVKLGDGLDLFGVGIDDTLQREVHD